MKADIPSLVCVGISHLTAPVEVREKLAFGPDELPFALAAASRRFNGAAILSTCNRTELYASVSDPRANSGVLIEFINGLKETRVDPALFYRLTHGEAVRHLFRVAAGIESMVLGEYQILGQVRDAMSVATKAGTLDGVLSRAFHSAISVGRRARAETAISRQAASISSAAVALARRSLGDLAGKTILVISAGETGKLAAKSLAHHARSRIIVANRHPGRAIALVDELGADAEAVPLTELPRALAEADIVISSTSAEGFVVGAADVREVMARRPERGLLFIDIAVPRDVDPRVAEIEGVHLYDIDDLEAVVASGLEGRQAEVGRVERIIEEEVDDFLRWWGSLDVVPVIAALRERAEAIRRQELEKTLRRMPDLDDEAKSRIEAMTNAIVKKMLDRPIARLKDGADKALYMDALQDLFDVHPKRGNRSPSG